MLARLLVQSLYVWQVRDGIISNPETVKTLNEEHRLVGLGSQIEVMARCQVENVLFSETSCNVESEVFLISIVSLSPIVRA
jgi:hypothetical protein